MFDPTTDELWLVVTNHKPKVSFKRGGCMTRFTNAGGSPTILYKIVNGQLVEVCRKDSSTHNGNCDRCGDNIDQVNQRGYSYVWRSGWQWVRGPGGKPVEPLQVQRLCAECGY